MKDLENNMIVIFDGVCNLCEGSVLFIIKRDKNAKFKFVQSQSIVGKKLQADFNINSIDSESIILIKKSKVFFKSNAALEVARYLDGAWKLSYIFKIIPTFIRDGAYHYIAKNRYKWYGKKNVCMMPTPELKVRFLE